MQTTIESHKQNQGVRARISVATATAVALGAVWISVVISSIFAPDMVTGSEHEHLPIAAMTFWFWGLITTCFVLVPAIARPAGEVKDDRWWRLLASGTSAIWTAVALASIFVPVLVTGSDPTRIPLAAILGPVFATAATALLSAAVAMLNGRH